MISVTTAPAEWAERHALERVGEIAQRTFLEGLPAPID